MRFFLAILGLFIDENIGYTYTINAKITKISRSRSTERFSYEHIGAGEGIIEYNDYITKENPFYIYATVNARTKLIFGNYEKDPLNSCSEYPDGSWDKVLVTLIAESFLPDGKCPANPLTEVIVNKNVKPINVTFGSMIPCGNYSLVTTLDEEREHMFPFNAAELEVQFDFTIEDDGNCEKSE